MSCEPRASVPAGLSLPVLGAAGSGVGAVPGGGPRRPRATAGRRRAIVLGIVQLLMIAHVVQWLWTGTTVSPVEPSEAMALAKDGVVNAGAVFFIVALASTALLGRWFCGWGCHVVLLQDLCGWMMKKVGIRPKLFRARLLLWLPLGLAVYMFLWPAFYRIAIAPFIRPELTWPGLRTEFVTSDFWATFPGLLMGAPFLLVCGFLTVYLLGAKGYCTYGCPYGGFFTPLDELSPVRIRVSDACTQCGHCTAVCTSNVRVHEEVRDWRMVVDPGCMKCLDCVSACPEQALRVGFGTPAFLAKPVVEKPAQRRWDLTWNEEIALAAVALGSFFAVRGMIGVPLLFASGIAISATYLAYLLWRTWTARDLRLHRLALKRGGRVLPAGRAVGAASGLVLAVLAYVGLLNATVALAEFSASRVRIPPEVVFSGSPVEPEAPVAAAARRAIALYDLARPMPRGIGFSGPWTPVLEVRSAWLESATLEHGAAEARLREAAARDGMSEPYAVGIARAIRGSGRLPDAIAFARAEWRRRPAWEVLREELIVWLAGDGRRDEALAIAREAVALRPDDLNAMRRLSLVLVDSSDPAEVEEGIAVIDRTLVIAPDNPYAYRARAAGLRTLERIDEAEADLRRAIELAPEAWQLHQDLGELLMAHDRLREGAVFLKRAGELRVRGGGRGGGAN